MSQQDMDSYAIGGGNVQFSAVSVDSLGAPEYTLVDIEADDSGSVSGFRADLIDRLKEIVRTCAKSPRADNLLLRLGRFGRKAEEVHGFKELVNCNPGDYDGALRCDAPRTALFDATALGVEAVDTLGRSLATKDYDCNGIVFILTDGDDNISMFSPEAVADKIRKAKGLVKDHNGQWVRDPASEGKTLESLLTILIGVNIQSSYIAQKLEAFQREAGIDQFVKLEDASSKSLAKLAQFVSQSISSQSQALGTGGPSKTIDPNALSI